MTLCVMGAGAFGTALAVSFARGSAARDGGDVMLWGRDGAAMAEMDRLRENRRRLPGVPLPANLHPVSQIPTQEMEAVLLVVPMQQLPRVLAQHADVLRGAPLIACCKGLSLDTGAGPSAMLETLTSAPAILTGPSFATDIAQGFPTALTLACRDQALGRALQSTLTAPNLRLYRSQDVIGAELGGAVKNVVAIGCGAVMGAGLGVSARAALMTRGFAEMRRFAEGCGADPVTLMGLSGLGDLTLTCTSENSRNYRFGAALGAGETFDPSVTVEGAATARALWDRADRAGIDMPVTRAIVALLDGELDVRQAVDRLLTRPMKEE